MEITSENEQEVLEYLTQLGAVNLRNHLEEMQKINREEYPIGSEYGTDKGYGARLFLIKNLKELAEVKEECALLEAFPELEEVLHEPNGKITMFVHFLLGSDSAVSMFLVDEND